MMAGFSGKLNLNGRGAIQADAQLLARKMVLPPDATKQERICGALALAAAVPSNRATPEGVIFASDDGRCILSGSGSVYNREELIDSLKCSATPTDVELMWLSWLKWEAASPSRLDGDWMFAVYDRPSGQLLLARSWGYSALYYYLGEDFIAFATHPVSLATLPYVPGEPDLQTVVRIGCNLPLAPHATCWQGIFQVPPASKIQINGRQVREETWWRPSNIRREKVDNEPAALNKFLELYRRAVSRRIRTSEEVGATLSSGLDSTSLAALAAQELAPGGKVLQAWTSVPLYPDEAYAFGSWVSDESALASRAAVGMSNIKHQLVYAADSSPIAAIRQQIVRTGRPHRSGVNQFWLDHIIQTAADSGCKVLFIGQMGNGTVSWSPAHLSLLPKGKYFPHTPWKKYLGIAKRKLKWNLKRTKRNLLDILQKPEIRYPLINPRFLYSKEFKQSIRLKIKKPGGDHAGWAEAHMNLFDTWYHSSFWSGVEVRDPTMDTQLTEYLVALPDPMYFRDGLDRRLIRLGMAQHLPDEIRFNKRRGQQGSDIIPRIRQFSEEASQALSLIRQSELAGKLLNLTLMNEILQRIVQGETNAQIWRDCAGILLPGLSVGIFLAAIEGCSDFPLHDME